MEWHREVEFTWAVAPLVLLLCGVPTLDELAEGRLLWPRPVLLEPRELVGRYQDFVLCERGLREGRWWTLVSHAFLHQGQQHLLSNLQGIAVSGFGAFMDGGVPGLYGAFFAGVAASALNQQGRKQQTQAQIEGAIPRAPEQVGPVAVPELARSSWDALRRGVARCTSPAVSARVEAYGASGGVSGLMGYGMATTLVQLCRRPGREAGIECDVGADGAWPQRGLNTVMSVVNVLRCGHFLASEWGLARGEQGLTGVDHSGHLTGFAAGALLALLAAGARWAACRGLGPRSWPPPGPGWPGRAAGGGPRRRYVDASGELVER